MPPINTAELRRLHAQGERSSHSFYVFDSIPAILDELEAAREEVRRLTQANGDLRKQCDRAVAEAQQDGARLDSAMDLGPEENEQAEVRKAWRKYLDTEMEGK